MTGNQLLFNIAVTVIILLVGWWNKNIWDSIKECKDLISECVKNYNDFKLLVVSDYVQKADFDESVRLITSKLDALSNIEVILAQTYVTQKRFDHTMSDIATRLDHIADKLEAKADRR